MSRSGKRILHIDKNDYYGQADAAFSLQEAEDFAKQVDGANSGDDAAFRNISIFKPQQVDADSQAPSLSFSRAYTLALCPQLVYARSALLQYLVSSKVHQQLEFLAVGSWWVYTPSGESLHGEEPRPGHLFKVPSSREDIFSDKVLDFKAKRALTKFLRFIVEYEEQPELWEVHKDKPFTTFLTEQFRVPETLHPPLLALSLSPNGQSTTTTEFALSRIARHMRSIGMFGSGFGSVIPKWGGMSEVTQVACRACAVGGGVYVLGRDITGFASTASSPVEGLDSPPHVGIKVHLRGGETVTTRWVVGQSLEGQSLSATVDVPGAFCKSITIISSSLPSLFPPIAEEAPPPACAVVTFPSGSLKLDSMEVELPPVHIFVHSADTGECAVGQCVLYASTSLAGMSGFELLKAATEALICSVDITPMPVALWSMQYEQSPRPASTIPSSVSGAQDHILNFPPPSLDLAFDDGVLEQVKQMWEKLKGDDTGEFLVFGDRTVDLEGED